MSQFNKVPDWKPQCFDSKYLDPRYFWNNLENFSLSSFDEKLLQEIPTTMIALSVDDIIQLVNNIDFIIKGQLTENIPHKNEINKTISKYGGKAFFKLSMRSPKDSLFYKIRSIKNSQPIEFAVRNATELYQCLFTSLRTIIDIMRSLITGISIHIVLRKYIIIPKWQEFRCFIMNGKLLGISQYCSNEYFPELQNKENLILTLIQKKLKSIQDRIPSTCILDVYIENLKKVIVLELNPFGCGAGALLYHNGNYKTLRKTVGIAICLMNP